MVNFLQASYFFVRRCFGSISWSRVAGVVALLALMATICPAQAVEPIRIASVFAKTGPGAEENSPNYRVVALAAKQVNAQGGLLGRSLEVVEFDTGSTVLGARQAAFDAVKAGGAASAPLWYFMALGIGALTFTFPFSQAMSVTAQGWPLVPMTVWLTRLPTAS